MKRNRAWVALVAVLPLLVALAAPAVARAADDPAKVLPGLEKSLWEAWKNHDVAPFEKHIAVEAVNTGSSGRDIGKAAIIKAIQSSDCVVTSYSLGEIAVHKVSDSTVVLTYDAKQDATCKGAKIPAEVLATSVWVNQGGTWLNAVYHESLPPKK